MKRDARDEYLMRIVEPPLALVVNVDRVEIFHSRLLGEIFNRKNNSDGFSVTQPLRDAVDLKPLNRLSQTSEIVIDRAELCNFISALKKALDLSTARWFWFVSLDELAPPGMTERRVTMISGPEYHASAGMNKCIIITNLGEFSLVDKTSVDTDEGVIGVKSESAKERYGPELDALSERLLLHESTAVTITLYLSKIKREEQSNVWKTFDRKRLPNKAKPLSNVVRSVLGKELELLGFEEREVFQLKIWAKSTGSNVHYIAFDRASFSSEFRIFIGIDTMPFFGGRRVPGEHLAEFHDGAQCWPFSSQSHLELRLKQAWAKLNNIAPIWFANPLRYSWKEWRERGLDSKSG